MIIVFGNCIKFIFFISEVECEDHNGDILIWTVCLFINLCLFIKFCTQIVYFRRETLSNIIDILIWYNDVNYGKVTVRYKCNEYKKYKP